MKLNLIGVVESPNCTFCQEAAEYVEHLLFSCRISCDFWKDVLSWVRDNDVRVETINESDVIFGYLLFGYWLGQDLSSILSSISPGRKINFFFIFKSGRS